MTRQFEISSNLRAQQARNVGAVGVIPTLIELTTDRRTANMWVALQHSDFESRLGKVGRIGQPVVARPDNDGVVFIHAVLRQIYGDPRLGYTGKLRTVRVT